MRIDKLSLYVIAMNEERRLPRVLDSVKGIVDEIVVIDSGSTDRTEEIARSYGARFIHNDWISVGHQAKFAEEQCSHDWVLRLDADEVVSPELADEIMSIRQNATHDGYILRIGEIFPGMKRPNRWVKHYDRLIRLYDRRAWQMTGEWGHDDVAPVRPNATKTICRAFIHHYSFISISQIVEKYNIESTRLVDRAHRQGKRYPAYRMCGCMFGNFFKYFILGRFFLLGWWGFIHSINIGYLRYLKFAKFYEITMLEVNDYAHD